MNIKEYMKDNVIFLDGGMGTTLQKAGLKPGELPEEWNIEKPELISKIHQDYFDAGSNVVNTNTFGANSLKFDDEKLEAIIKAAVENARVAQGRSLGGQEKWVALDIGPTGRMLAPYGDLYFHDAVEIFAKTVRLGVKYGVDLIFIETMNDSYETKAALLAAKENSKLPVFVSNAYSEGGKLMTGASPLCMISMLESMGADAIGVNCSYGPKELTAVMSDYLRYASVPVIMKPNAGIPKSVDGETVFDVKPAEFADAMTEFIKNGVRVAGGCCGTTPSYIYELTQRNTSLVHVPLTNKDISVVSSYSKAVTFGTKPILIGERINPTGKPKLKEAIKTNDMDYILREALSQEEKGADVLDVNVGLPEIDEREVLTRAVVAIQGVCDLPLQIDTTDIRAMETAMRFYNGKPLINSVNGKAESMKAVFPLVKKYGGMVVALTLDENGIPETAIGRMKIAQKILAEAQKYGIRRKDIIFDPLALAMSADGDAARVTLEAVELIEQELGALTSLGVSNVSYGMPRRDIVNSSFFTVAMDRGLSAAIMNPHSQSMMGAYKTFCAISGYDTCCMDYINYATNLVEETVSTQTVKTEKLSGESTLQDAIIKGMANSAEIATKELLKEQAGIDIIKNHIIPALDTVGVGFENKTVYLPQLLMSAEAAKSAFEVIKAGMEEAKSADKCTVVIATVEGDIHDIGKNILKLLLENYGFDTIDLGKDVPPAVIVAKVVEKKAAVLGLSALMTTTVPAMQKTIELVKKGAPWCKVMVGGAVLNQDYADMIGADHYAKDAMEGIRYCEEECV